MASPRECVGEWISVDERLPGFHESVLMLFLKDEIAIGYLCNNGEWEARADDWNLEGIFPSHWMPLPQLPTNMINMNDLPPGTKIEYLGDYLQRVITKTEKNKTHVCPRCGKNGFGLLQDRYCFFCAYLDEA